MCADVPQQRLDQRPDDAAEDHGLAQSRAVCKAATSVTAFIMINVNMSKKNKKKHFILILCLFFESQ